MTNNSEKINYAAPQCEVLTVQCEGVIALSGLTDYDDGGTF